MTTQGSNQLDNQENGSIESLGYTYDNDYLDTNYLKLNSPSSMLWSRYRN